MRNIGRIILAQMVLAAGAMSLQASEQDSSPSMESTITVNDFEFPVAVTIANESVPLRGTHTFTWWGFDVYTIAFYVPRDAANVDEMLHSSTPRKLILHYHRDIEGNDFQEATRKALRKNPEISTRQIREPLLKLYNTYTDIEEDDRYSIVYDGEGTTTLYLNDEHQNYFEGSEFSRAFFGIWISDYAIDDDMAEDLRGED